MSAFGEPLEYYSLGNNSGIRDSYGDTIIDIDPLPGCANWAWKNGCLKRICESVNACAGIANPAGIPAVLESCQKALTTLALLYAEEACLPYADMIEVAHRQLGGALKELRAVKPLPAPAERTEG